MQKHSGIFHNGAEDPLHNLSYSPAEHPNHSLKFSFPGARTPLSPTDDDKTPPQPNSATACRNCREISRTANRPVMLCDFLFAVGASGEGWVSVALAGDEPPFYPLPSGRGLVLAPLQLGHCGEGRLHGGGAGLLFAGRSLVGGFLEVRACLSLGPWRYMAGGRNCAESIRFLGQSVRTPHNMFLCPLLQ